MGVYKQKRADKSTMWYYDFSYRKQRYRGLGGATKTQALRTLEKVRSQVLSGEYELEEKAKNPKFEDFARKYLAYRRHRLRGWKRDDLSARTLLKSRRFRAKNLSRIGQEDIEGYIADRKSDGVANGTINRELACLKRMYSLAIKWRDAKRNPAQDVDLMEEPPGRSTFLTIEEAERLVVSCAEHLRPIVLLALNTGMRLGEILNLTWDRVHIGNVINPHIEIIEAKNNKRRYIPLNNEMVEVLDGLRAKKRDFEQVFLSTHGKPLQSVRKPFQKALARTGIDDFRFHDLRHTFASHFIMRGGDMLTLKEILGHSSMQMVERYAHLAAAHKQQQINNLSGIFSKKCHLYATKTNSPNIPQKTKAL